MGLGGLLEGSNNSYNTLTSASVWMIISAVVAIIGGIALYFTVFSKQNEDKYTGFMKWLYDFFTFKKMVVETLLRIIYIIVAVYITLSSFSLISISFVGFLVQLVFGNLVARLVFEFSLLMLTICKNTTEINDKLSKAKKEEKKEKEVKESKKEKE